MDGLIGCCEFSCFVHKLAGKNEAVFISYNI